MSECGRTPTNPNGYGGMDFTPPVTHPDYRDARIAELERQLAEAKADSERLDWLIEGKWEVYPSGRKYCIAHDIYDAVYGPDLRQAIDNAREESE